MFTSRRFLPCTLLLLLVPLAGCAIFSADAWQRPSPFSAPPPRPPENHEVQGGFAVLVDVPGQPTSARVFTDIAAFAQQHGFVAQAAPPAPPVDQAVQSRLAPAPQRFLMGKIILDIRYDAAHLRVNASLHSLSHQLSRKFNDQFYRGFHQQYAGAYGDEGSIIESDYADGSGGLPVGGRGSSGGERGGRR